MQTGAAITHYQLLRVSRRERPEGVRAAYRRLAQQFHPDKQRGNADAERVMAAINQAYAVLSDPAQRADYDRALDSGFSHSRPASLDDVRAHDRAWPWWLLFGTIAFSAVAVGISLYKSYMPGVRGTVQVVTSATPSR